METDREEGGNSLLSVDEEGEDVLEELSVRKHHVCVCEIKFLGNKGHQVLWEDWIRRRER